jgi:hypothetical protein
MNPGSLRTGRCLLLVALAGTAGCASTSFDRARDQFYAGRAEQADQTLAADTPKSKDQILYLMERGMVRQQAGRYQESSRDFITAADKIEEFETYSLSRGAGSWVVNDTLYTFRGKPYERALLHAFTALNFFAEGDWEGAAVEARRIHDALQPAVLGDYPDDPYARYVAGFCMEMLDDPSNAAVQYQKASDLADGVVIDPDTGHVAEPSESPTTPASAPAHELICFIQMGRAARPHPPTHPRFSTAGPVYAELYAGDLYLGRSYTLVDTARLAELTMQEESTRTTLKTAARIAFKEGLAQAAASGTNHEEVGDLTRLILFGLLEQPDFRHWSTLPRWLQVARVPCPPGLRSYLLVVKHIDGRELARYTVDTPLARKEKTVVSFHRHLPTY